MLVWWCEDTDYKVPAGESVEFVAGITALVALFMGLSCSLLAGFL